MCLINIILESTEITLTMGRVRNKLNDLVRPFINHRNRKRLKNHDFSLIANNCNGAFILHDLGMRFNSPFVNLWIKPDDYIKILSDLQGYMDEDLTFVTEDSISYPIGLLRDVRIYFQHYDTEEEAKQKWNSRRLRLNYDNIFVLLTDKDGCTQKELESFDKLPYKNKLVFTNKFCPKLKSVFHIKGFENQKEVGDCFAFVPNKIGVKYYDQFDYVKWFNNTL